ncbi:hypothetical protein C8R44DRAFT_813220 [Mycena epipterygia]|nr:hypothetical protein C8R44DRAFT_813220 [Mycena epipterygia]
MNRLDNIPSFYVYSDTDRCPLLIIEEKGLNVRDEELFGSIHVQHSKVNHKRY